MSCLLQRRSLVSDAFRLAIVMLVAAGTSFAVTGLQLSDDGVATSVPSAGPVNLDQRATVSLMSVTIEPVLSGDGRVVPGQDDDTWIIEAPIAPADQAYRLIDEPVGVRARILGGPSGFACVWLPLGVGPDGSVAMRCRIPANIPVVEALDATMVVQLDEPADVTALPVTAVVGSATQGEVIEIMADGEMAVRTVELGMSDTFHIEIMSGLSSNATVLESPIQRDFLEARQ